jgi:hypothetical protein
MLLLLVPLAQALSLSLTYESTPYPGVTYREYRTSSPSTNTFVTLIDLCTDRIHVAATEYPDVYQSTKGWASDVGVQVATNGDFYKTSPSRVYGDAIGKGNPWKTLYTGRDSSYSSEWYYKDYGWIAFGWDQVWFSHTKNVKANAATWGLTDGWDNSTYAPDPPAGVLALVSGFPELVIEGTQYTCTSPTASDCFPDRSDMRDRHPRTAMGLTADKQTFILAVVDGRTSESAGMYGAELASLMYQLGAYVAFNLDGGGSSQMVVAGSYKNDYDGNNYGSGARTVMNHWGVYAGTTGGAPTRPGHCVSKPACETLPAAGGTIEEDTDCFGKYGDAVYWREETAGDGGHLYWTNAWKSDYPGNWAWWQLNLEEAGLYKVEAYIDSTWGVYADTPYVVRADGVDTDVIINQGAASGWTSLGEYTFAAGGDQWVRVNDDSTSSVASSQHIAIDALRLTRVGPYCGDAACDEGETCNTCDADCGPVPEVAGNAIDDDCDGVTDELPAPDDSAEPVPVNPADTSETGETASPDTAPADEDSAGPLLEPEGLAQSKQQINCACASTRAPLAWPALALLGLLWRRRSR